MENITRDTNSVENWFRILKHAILDGKRILRLGKFVSCMHKTLMGRIKLSQLGIGKRKTKEKSSENMMWGGGGGGRRTVGKERKKGTIQEDLL